MRVSHALSRCEVQVTSRRRPSPLPLIARSNKRSRFSTKASRRSVLLGGFCPCCCGCCKPKAGWYDKFFAYAMATGMDAYEEAVLPFKRELLREATAQGGSQDLLEIGIGAAPNLQFLVDPASEGSKGMRVTGIDPNPFMFDYARESAAAAGLADDALDLQLGVAEDLPFADASFDTVLCSVPDVTTAVREMRRVLRPGGKAVFLEHVLAAGDRPLLRLSQQILNPAQQLLADGCHLNRNPLEAFEAAGFSSLETKSFDVPGMGPIAPHIAGTARA